MMFYGFILAVSALFAVLGGLHVEFAIYFTGMCILFALGDRLPKR